MLSMTKLSQAEITSALEELPDWTVKDEKLHREYGFEDFIHAWGFMSAAAVVVEALGHHPEWFNVYNRVTVDLTTHDAGGITENDVELARRLEALAAKMLP